MKIQCCTKASKYINWNVNKKNNTREYDTWMIYAAGGVCRGVMGRAISPWGTLSLFAFHHILISTAAIFFFYAHSHLSSSSNIFHHTLISTAPIFAFYAHSHLSSINIFHHILILPTTMPIFFSLLQ